MVTDPGLRFWLRYVDVRGGLAEPAADGTLVVLPPDVATEFDLPEEMVVTTDPETARDDGVVLLATGHPVLSRAADAALTDGDAGIVPLAAPGGPPPGIETLQERLRADVHVAHGRIQVTGLPRRIDRPVIRLGALVTYTVSAEECYQERLECWVDAPTGLPLRPELVSRVQRAPLAQGARPATEPVLRATSAALEAAHSILEAAADRRRVALSEQASDAHHRERSHALAYYADNLRSLERRRAAADPDRAELMAARAASTEEERARRLLEIDEKYQARHAIRPFRLHVALVPGWQVPADVCRGPRCYPITFDWLPALGVFAAQRCPHCAAAAPLSASKTRLGCASCLPGAPLHAVPATA